MRCRQKKYKLNPEELSKVYKITKRKTPSIPRFIEDQNKLLLDTDTDYDHL